ncbi:MAG: hypothetical protein AB2693_08550, partial [Candidatus Thiodiazotropha sp.]
AEDAQEISSHIFFKKYKQKNKVSSAAVLLGTLRVKSSKLTGHCSLHNVVCKASVNISDL